MSAQVAIGTIAEGRGEKTGVNRKERNLVNLRRFFTIVAPFLLLLACLAIINVLPHYVSFTGNVAAEPSATAPVRPSPTRPPATSTVPLTQNEASTPIPAMTATVTASPSPMPIPTLPAGAMIHLLGPPDKSEFSTQDSITFYWDYAHPLPEGSSFVLFFMVGNEEHQLNAGDRPNLGSAYRTRVSPGELASSADIVQWRVMLQTPLTTSPLMESETRSIRLLPGP